MLHTIIISVSHSLRRLWLAVIIGVAFFALFLPTAQRWRLPLHLAMYNSLNRMEP